MLVDVRFRLLAFVPTATAFGVGVIKDQAAARLGVGIIGLVVTVGVVMYEIRNSQLRDAAVHRMSAIERWLEGSGC